MKRGVCLILAAIAIIYLGVCVTMFALQRSLLYYPTSRAVLAPESTMALPVPGAELVVTVRPRVRRPSFTLGETPKTSH
jgi:hypothetical protein